MAKTQNMSRKRGKSEVSPCQDEPPSPAAKRGKAEKKEQEEQMISPFPKKFLGQPSHVVVADGRVASLIAKFESLTPKERAQYKAGHRMRMAERDKKKHLTKQQARQFRIDHDEYVVFTKFLHARNRKLPATAELEHGSSETYLKEKKYFVPRYPGYYAIMRNGQGYVCNYSRPPTVWENRKIKLKTSGKEVSAFLWRFIFEAVCPDEFDKKMQIDHVDGNRANNHITNLQQVTLRENTRRAHAGRPRPESVRRQSSKPLFYVDLRSSSPSEILEAESGQSACRKIGASSADNISRCAKKNTEKKKEELLAKQYSEMHKVAKRYVFWRNKPVEEEMTIGGEAQVWKTNETLILTLMREGQKMSRRNAEKVRVGSFGQIINVRGRRTSGTKVGKYRLYSSIRVHKLVLVAFFEQQWNSRPDGSVVRHKGDEFDEEGCLLNYAKYLKLGSQQDNAIDHHELEVTSGRKPRIHATDKNNNDELRKFRSIREASNALGISYARIKKAFDKNNGSCEFKNTHYEFEKVYEA